MAKGAVRLISLLRRKDGTGHDDFLTYWRGSHGPLIAGRSAANYARRYEQYPAAWPEPGSGAPEPEWDGVTVQEFDSVDAFWAHVREPDFPAIQADVAEFLDTDRIAWVLVEAPDVVIGPDVRGPPPAKAGQIMAGDGPICETFPSGRRRT